MKYIKRKYISAKNNLEGNIVDTTNINDKTKNAPSIRLAEEMINSLNSYTNCIETSDFNFESGYYAESGYLSKIYYNKLTRQVTIIGFIRGSITENWTKIITLDSKYRPPSAIYFESTTGVTRALIRVESDGSVYAYCNQSMEQIRFSGTYYTF